MKIQIEDFHSRTFGDQIREINRKLKLFDAGPILALSESDKRMPLAGTVSLVLESRHNGYQQQARIDFTNMKVLKVYVNS